MFPNGYNKKWNCNRETREEIEKEILKERKENKVEEKISMGDSFIEDKDFSLEENELYWNGGKKKLSCPINNEIKEILNTLQENQKIIVKIDRDSDGKCKAIQIISI
jgi:hypothetical protein